MERHKKKHGDKSFSSRLLDKENNANKNVYNDIQVVYVTFLSMEAKNLVYERLMPQSGKLDPVL